MLEIFVKASTTYLCIIDPKSFFLPFYLKKNKEKKSLSLNRIIFEPI